MATVSSQELEGKSELELQELLQAGRLKLAQCRVQVGQGSLRQVRQLRVMRRRVAQILTRLNRPRQQ